MSQRITVFVNNGVVNDVCGFNGDQFVDVVTIDDDTELVDCNACLDCATCGEVYRYGFFNGDLPDKYILISGDRAKLLDAIIDNTVYVAKCRQGERFLLTSDPYGTTVFCFDDDLLVCSDRELKTVLAIVRKNFLPGDGIPERININEHEYQVVPIDRFYTTEVNEGQSIEPSPTYEVCESSAGDEHDGTFYINKLTRDADGTLRRDTVYERIPTAEDAGRLFAILEKSVKFLAD